jgi:hypothetical protein
MGCPCGYEFGAKPKLRTWVAKILSEGRVKGSALHSTGQRVKLLRYNFMQVASKAASQKATASGIPDKYATLGNIADGSFLQTSAGQIYQSFC